MWPLAVSALRPALPPPPPEAADKSGHRSSPTPSETLLVSDIYVCVCVFSLFQL
uniref:Uncharacterized protein n=1 Tax=Solanum tuberosum TaxID=4113 RepID=M1CDX1_SOLTU